MSHTNMEIIMTALALTIIVLGTIITIKGDINTPNWKVWEWLSKVASATFEIRF